MGQVQNAPQERTSFSITHHPRRAGAGAQEAHARGSRGSQGMLSMDQALEWEGRQYRAEHSHKANTLSLGTIKCWCLEAYWDPCKGSGVGASQLGLCSAIRDSLGDSRDREAHSILLVRLWVTSTAGETKRTPWMQKQLLFLDSSM